MKDLLKEGSSTTSSKRLVGVVGALILFVSLLLSHFTEYKPDEHLVNAVMVVTATSLGFTSVEKFRKNERDT